MKQKTLGIVGVGMLGCSIALRYRSIYAQADVLGLDANVAHLDIATARQAITGTAHDLRNLVTRADVVVLAAPVGGIIAILHELSRMALEQTGPALILDVASVKVSVCEAGAGVPHFVGTHPMAGSESNGPTGARGDLFEGRPWAFVSQGDAGANTAALAFIDVMGARAIELTAAYHDTLVARTSHLPQTLSTLLAVRALREPVQGFYGQGLLDMVRLARSSDTVWVDIYDANADAISAELRAYAHELEEFATALQAHDRAAVSEIFQKANDRTRHIV